MKAKQGHEEKIMNSRLVEKEFSKHIEDENKSEGKAEGNSYREEVRGLSINVPEKRHDLQRFKMVSNRKAIDTTCTIKSCM